MRGAWSRSVVFVPVCPEVELGLGVPRPPIRLAKRGGRIRLERVVDGADLTVPMRRFSQARCADLKETGLDGFILKKNSPSCGVRGVPVFGGARKTGRGFFADALVRMNPGLPVVEEADLETAESRAAFLLRVKNRHA